MTILSGTTLSGIPDQQANTGQPVTARHMQNIAKDHGYVFEGLTGKKSDGSGGASVVTAHTHIESGNKLIWPLINQHFGPGHFGVDSDTTLPNSSQFLEPDYFQSSSATVENIIAWYVPFFVPPAWVSLPLLVGFEAWTSGGNDVTLTATLETWGTPDASIASPQKAYTVATSVSGQVDRAFVQLKDTTAGRMMSVTRGNDDDLTCWVTTVTPAASGLHALRINMVVGDTQRPLNGTASMFVIPVASKCNIDLVTKPSLPTDGTNIAIVGDADGVVSNDYLPMDDSLVASNDPLGAASVINNFNSAYLEELATGLPCSGNNTLTVAHGHDHSNPAAAPWYGSGIEFNFTCKPLGTISTNGAIKGPRFKAPQLAATVITFQKFIREWIYTPQFTGTQKLYCAAIVRHDFGKAQGIEVKFTTTPEGGGSTSVTLTSATGGGGSPRYELITDITNTLTWKSGGRTLLEVEARHTSNTGATDSILGYAVWTDY